MLIAWPGWSVQQDLGSLSGTVGTFRIWMSSDLAGSRSVKLNAALIDATTRKVLRQAFVTVSRRYIPTAHTLTFPAYVAPSDQRLMLQLGVPESHDRHVIYRLANPHPTRANVMVNGVPDSGRGPLAFAHMRTGSGLRAALDGDVSGRLRLILGLVSGALAALAHPRLTRKLGPLANGAGSQVEQMIVRVGRMVRADAGRTPRGPAVSSPRWLQRPWYPWPAAAAPILHYLASNPLHFAVSESIAPLAAVLGAVTIGVVGLRVGLNDWHRAAAATTVVTVIVFAYGHIASAINGRLDDRLMFGMAVACAALAIGLTIRRDAMALRLAPFLNLTTAVLLVFPVASLVTEAASAQSQRPTPKRATIGDHTANLTPTGQPQISGKRPDIYYIILDAYARQDTLLDIYDFDNSDFLHELERRGFYIASEATSNYTNTNHSVASLLNLAYLDELGPRAPTSRDDLVSLVHYNALAAILKDLGYTYIHLDSGYPFTDTSRLADHVISFTPSGTLIRPGEDANAQTLGDARSRFFSARFIRGLIRTTALGPVVGDHLIFAGSDPYAWQSPHRALAMFEFLSGEIDAVDPKFVFAHIVKPHHPYTFDQHGNIFGESRSFSDFHDPSVPSAFIGQLKYINTRVLEMIDKILQQSHPASPIIVISSDHAQKTIGPHRHAILSAFHLPNGGTDGLYPSISVVNHFRYILDFYFTFDLGLLEDQILWYPSETVDFSK